MRQRPMMESARDSYLPSQSVAGIATPLYLEISRSDLLVGLRVLIHISQKVCESVEGMMM